MLRRRRGDCDAECQKKGSLMFDRKPPWRRSHRVLVGNYYLLLISLKGAAEYRQVKVLEFFDCPGPRQGVEDLREVSNDDTAVAQRRLEDKQPEEKTNTDCLKPVDMLGSFGWLASIKQGILEPVKVKCIFLGYHKSIVGNKLWREQHLACELFGYRENSNEAAFVVAAVEKIYAHESLTFNNTVSCEVISKWKAGLKDDMDARSDVYVLSNDCTKCSDDSDGYYWGFYNEKFVQTLLEGHSILSLEGSLAGDCDVEKNGKWSCVYAVGSQEYQMVSTRPDIASTDVGMLDGFDRGLQIYVQVFVDFDYAMGRSITRYGFMILGCAGSLKANLQHKEALSTTKAGYMTFTEAWKKKIWLRGLLEELGADALTKVVHGHKLQHCLELLSVGIG
nr:zinc finger, CCHC-type [Tanacetum cinerariifolium]